MPFENSEIDVPEGQMRIAQRFNAGMDATPGKVPKGRLKDGNDRVTFGRPCGTRIQSTAIPALKRRAIIGMSLRDKFTLNFRKVLALNRFARRRRGAFLPLAFVVPLSGIAVLVHLLRSELGVPALPRQEFEGLGIVVCALAYMGIFLWRLSRALEREAQQVETSEKPSEIPSTVVRRMQTGE